jgi:hypothetical protein
VDQAGVSLAGLRTILQADETLWDLLNTPLMLSIAALAYKDRSAAEIDSFSTVEEHRAQLFAAYTDAMFHRRAKTASYSREQMERWLAWLARAMKAHDQSVLYLEGMQPDWLPEQKQQRLVTLIMSVISGLMFGLIYGLIVGLGVGLSDGLGVGLSDGLGVGLIYGLIGGLSVGIRSAVVAGLIGGLIGGLVDGLIYGLIGGLSVGIRSTVVVGLTFGLIGGLSVILVGYVKEIKPIEKVRWSLSTARYKWVTKLFKRISYGLIFGLSVGLIFGLIFGPIGRLIFGGSDRPFFKLSGGLIFGLIEGLIDGLIFGLIFGLIGGLSFGLFFGLIGGLSDGFTIGEIGAQSFPNEGIRRSARNALITGLIFGLIGGLIGGLPFGLFFILCFGLRFGGRACLHHLALRLLLWHHNYAPFNYVRFLDYATARIFLRKVGGGYIFVHRMLLDYFAAKPQDRAIASES